MQLPTVRRLTSGLVIALRLDARLVKALGDDAFSARTSLRLTIKLGPDSLFEEELK